MHGVVKRYGDAENVDTSIWNGLDGVILWRKGGF